MRVPYLYHYANFQHAQPAHEHSYGYHPVDHSQPVSYGESQYHYGYSFDSYDPSDDKITSPYYSAVEDGYMRNRLSGNVDDIVDEQEATDESLESESLQADAYWVERFADTLARIEQKKRDKKMMKKKRGAPTLMIQKSDH
jgi:hypothetical protein